MNSRTAVGSTLVFVLLLAVFWPVIRNSGLERTLAGHLASAYACFALLLAPLWFFGFDLADVLRRHLDSSRSRIAASAVLVVPYLVFAIPRHEFHWLSAIEMLILPVAICALFEFSRVEQRFAWQDAVVLFVLAALLLYRFLSPAWPYAGLGSLPKLYLADVALFAYLVVRRLDLGYSLVPQASAFAIGAREWLFFFPFAMAVGFGLHFIRFMPRTHSAGHIAATLVGTFLLVALPEELFFRGILQNLLQPLAGRARSLLIASVLFGLSHYPKGALFNWRYVIMATIAGIFYGRAWRTRRQILASSFTHTMVDVVWALWFR